MSHILYNFKFSSHAEVSPLFSNRRILKTQCTFRWYFNRTSFRKIYIVNAQPKTLLKNGGVLESQTNWGCLTSSSKYIPFSKFLPEDTFRNSNRLHRHQPSVFLTSFFLDFGHNKTCIFADYFHFPITKRWYNEAWMTIFGFLLWQKWRTL